MGKYIAKLSIATPFLRELRQVIPFLWEGVICPEADVYKQSGRAPAGLDFALWEEIGSP